MRLSAVALATLLAAPAAAETVTVFAAASLATSLDKVAGIWEQETGNEVVISYAGSGALAQQIINGAPADIFISASVDWMEAVRAEGLLQGEPVNLLGNDLVLISEAKDIRIDLVPGADLAGLLQDGKLAMGLLDSVPAGQYGKAALTSLGLWEAVAAAVVQVDSARAALALVARGEAPFGIVYATDAAAEPGVTVAGTFPPESHPPIQYPAGLLTDAAAPRAFFEALQGEEADLVFKSDGFRLPDGAE